MEHLLPLVPIQLGMIRGAIDPTLKVPFPAYPNRSLVQFFTAPQPQLQPQPQPQQEQQQPIFFLLPQPQLQLQPQPQDLPPTTIQFATSQHAPFIIHSLPVNPKLIGDGDGMIIHVDVSDSRSPFIVPMEIRKMVIARINARAAHHFDKADALRDEINRAGYRIIRGSFNDEILAKEYRVRLRGVDAPEMGMAYGEEAKEALINLIGGKSLKLVAYGNDPYGRLLADVYINKHFLQEILLKEGHVWHYQFFDKHPELARWQLEAQLCRKGLWANSNPQSPWDYKMKERKKNKCCQMR